MSIEGAIVHVVFLTGIVVWMVVIMLVVKLIAAWWRGEFSR